MGITSDGQVNAMGFLFKRSFEALAEISRFVAGLVQRVPKKPNDMKTDLQNSTASQGDCSWEVTIIFFFGKDGLNIGQILRSPSRNLR